MPLLMLFICLLLITSTYLRESESAGCPVVSHSLPPQGLQPARPLCSWNSPGKNTGVGCHSLLQGIFPTQGSNPGLLHCRHILYHLSHQGSPSTTVYLLNVLRKSFLHVLKVILPLWEQLIQFINKLGSIDIICLYILVCSEGCFTIYSS